MNHSPLDRVAETGTSFADRIKLLIQRVGSATEIARMCGFSEGVVRSWRDGNTDPSRARCVTLARTLGISLVWLVAGEGTALPELDPPGSDEQTTTLTHSLPHLDRGMEPGHAAGDGAMDGDRLHAAMRILQSELELAGNPLALADSGDLLASLYLALGPGGKRLDTGAMLAFNHQLAERVRGATGATIR